jgi:hypothetical protein
MNKRIWSSALVMIGLFVASCSKNPIVPPVVDPQPPPPAAGRISRIEYETNHVDATYNADGRINTITNKDLGGTILQTYTFVYANGKLSEVQFGGKWKYIYNGDLVSQVQTYNDAGVLKYQSVFTYNIDKKITERLESRIVGGTAYGQLRTLYEYNAEGNMSKKTIYQWVNADWYKAEELQYPEYDTHPNTAEHFENNPYLPAGTFSKNNPTKEIFIDATGPVTGTAKYEYTYDASGKPTTRKITYSYPNLPEAIEVTKLFY